VLRVLGAQPSNGANTRRSLSWGEGKKQGRGRCLAAHGPNERSAERGHITGPWARAAHGPSWCITTPSQGKLPAHFARSSAQMDSTGLIVCSGLLVGANSTRKCQRTRIESFSVAVRPGAPCSLAPVKTDGPNSIPCCPKESKSSGFSARKPTFDCPSFVTPPRAWDRGSRPRSVGSPAPWPPWTGTRGWPDARCTGSPRPGRRSSGARW
jgi:hypothetical protein